MEVMIFVRNPMHVQNGRWNLLKICDPVMELYGICTEYNGRALNEGCHTLDFFFVTWKRQKVGVEKSENF
jgi:hypothetical protein